MTRLFLQLAIREIEVEGRGMTQLSVSLLRTIATELTRLTNQDINSKQCRNKYQSLRRDWQAWQLLADSRRDAIGLGFDPVSGTFTAPPHFWSNLIANENVAKFRERPLEHEELMQRVFEEVTATGNYQCTPGARGGLDMGADFRRDLEDDNLDGTSDDMHNMSLGVETGDEVGTHARSMHFRHGTSTTPPSSDRDWSSPLCSQQRISRTPIPPHGPSSQVVLEHVDLSPPFPRSMPIYPGRDIRGNKCKTPSSGTESISESMNKIVETIANKKPYKGAYQHGCNMVDVMKVLEQMECFQVQPTPRSTGGLLTSSPRIPLKWRYLLACPPMTAGLIMSIGSIRRRYKLHKECMTQTMTCMNTTLFGRHTLRLTVDFKKTNIWVYVFEIKEYVSVMCTPLFVTTPFVTSFGCDCII